LTLDVEFWPLVIVIGVAVMAMVVVAWLRKRHLQRTVRLELVNQGNMRSRYQLRAADPANDLSFGFSLEGDPLPEEAVFDEEVGAGGAADLPVPSRAPVEPGVVSGSPGATGGVLQKADQAMTGASSLAGRLTALGTTLPRPLGAPLMRVASQIQQAQVRTSRAQQAPRRAASFGAKVAARAEPRAGAAADTTGAATPAGSADRVGAAHPDRSARRSVAHVWAETPSLAPGEALTLDLLIRSASTSPDQQYTFQVVSRSVEGKDSPPAVAESSVQIRGGFWARLFLPQVLIVAVAIVALAAVYLPQLLE
jgi:hypothetical protein